MQKIQKTTQRLTTTLHLDSTMKNLNNMKTDIKQEIDKVGGTITSEVSYEKGNALVTYDSTKTSVQNIEKAIDSTGYMVTEYKIK